MENMCCHRSGTKRSFFHIVAVKRLMSSIIISCFVLTGCVSKSSRAQQMEEKDTNWSTQLLGGKWGWRLSFQLDNIYKIDGQTALLLRKTADSPQRILWNPITGVQRELDSEELAEFRRHYASNILPSFVNENEGHLHVLGLRFLDGRFLASFTTPQVVYRCQSMNFRYYEIARPDGTKATFYLIHKLEHPTTVEYFTCPEAEGSTEHQMMVTFLMDFNLAADLSDGSVLFMAPDGSGHLLIVRLDQSLRQHSSVGGRVFEFDAKLFNESRISVRNDMETYQAIVKYAASLPGSLF